MNRWTPRWARVLRKEPSVDDTKPSAEGLHKYPPEGRYEGYACTCKPECTYDCKGQCGCRACNASYQDFLSTE